MKIIIGAGTGLIGQALSASLVSDGHTVVVLSRDPQKYTGRIPEGVQLIAWDGVSQGAWSSHVDGADVVLNLAGENLSAGRWTAERKHRILESRTKPGQALTVAIRQAAEKPKTFVQTSAVGYYGITGDEIITEESPPGTDFLAEVTQAWENSSFGVEALGVRRVIVRTGVVLSADGGVLSRLLMPFKFYAGGRIGSGKQWFPWIHIADEIAAIRFLIDQPKARGVYNLSAPNPVTNQQLASALGKTLGRPAILPAPAFAIKILFGEMSIIVLEGQREIPKKLMEAGYQFKYETIDAALSDLLKK